MEEQITNIIEEIFSFGIMIFVFGLFFKNFAKITANTKDKKQTSNKKPGNFFNLLKDDKLNKNNIPQEFIDTALKIQQGAAKIQRIFIGFFVFTFAMIIISIIGTEILQQYPQTSAKLLENPETLIPLVTAGIAIAVLLGFTANRLSEKMDQKNRNNQLMFQLQRNSNKPNIKEEMEKFKRIKKLKVHPDAPDQVDLLAIYKDDSQHWYRAIIKGQMPHQRIVNLSRYS